jgi:NitT/TauT family transport system substrate-binding protein
MVQPLEHRHHIARVMLPLVTAFVLGACSGAQATPSAAPSTTTPSSASSPAGSGGTVALPAPEVSAVKIGYIITAADPANEIAIEDGLFTKYGVNVTVQTFTTETQETQALLAGQIDFIGNEGTSEPIGSLKTSTPLIIPFMNHDNIGDNLFTSANVKTAADLKGKSIAISTFGSSVYGEGLIFVQSLGLAPSDVTFTPIGNDAARRAALAAGSVAGSIDDQALASQMTAAGFNVLVLGSKMTVGLPQSALVTTQAYMQKNPNTTLAIVAALTEGMHIFLTNETQAEQAAIKFETIDMPTAVANYQGNLAGWSPINGRTTLDEMKAAQTLFAKTDPTLATVDVSKVFTNQFFDQLQTLGWYQSMGITP